MIEIILRIYLMGVIISSILSALTIYLLKEDFVDENFGIFCVLFITQLYVVGMPFFNYSKN